MKYKVRLRDWQVDLRDLGVKKGDTVIIYMPMMPRATFSMLACARIGAIHSVVFGGFAPHELAIRIDDCKPKVIITATSGMEVDRLIAYKPLVDEAVQLATHKPDKVIVYQRNLGAVNPKTERYISYKKLVKNSEPVDCVEMNSTDPLIYFIYFWNYRKTKRYFTRYRWLCNGIKIFNEKYLWC